MKKFFTNKWLWIVIAVVIGLLIYDEVTRPSSTFDQRSSDGFLASNWGWFLVAGFMGFLVYIIFSKGDDAPPISREKAETLESNVLDAYGRASWTTPKEFSEETIGQVETGLLLGRIRSQSLRWSYSGWLSKKQKQHDFKIEYGLNVYTHPESNTLICAPPGTGKGTSIIIPTLLKYSQSVFTIDPKGENCAVTLKARQDMGQEVHVLNPWGLLPDHINVASSHINPMDLIIRNDPTAVSKALALTDMIMIPPTGNGDEFWDTHAKTVIQGLILFIAGDNDPDLQNYDSNIRNLTQLRRLITLPTEEFMLLVHKMSSSTLYQGALSEAGGTVLSMPERTFGNVLATAQSHTSFLNDPIIKQATSKSDFNFNTLKEKPSTVYVIIPAEHLATQGRWLRLMTGMALMAMETGSMFQYRTQFLIDEFPALGRMSKILSGVATLRGYGADITLICQDLSQLKIQYEEDGMSVLMANCSWKYFAAIADLGTAKYVSDMMGNRTVTVESTSESTRYDAGTQTSKSKTGMPLRSPSELLISGGKDAVVLRSHGRPIFVEPQHYYETEGLSNLASPNPYFERKQGTVFSRPPAISEYSEAVDMKQDNKADKSPHKQNDQLIQKSS